MRRIACFLLAVSPLIGCAPSPSPRADESPAASVQEPPIARASLGDMERSGAPPPVPWPAHQAGSASIANKAEMAIIWRSHELREKHPGATPGELAQMLTRDNVWDQNARFIPPARRTFVTREAFLLW